MEESTIQVKPRNRPESRASTQSHRSNLREQNQQSESESEDDENELDPTAATPRPTAMPGRFPDPKYKGKEPELTHSERAELLRLRQELARIRQTLHQATRAEQPTPY